jgi:cysteine desulfurase
MEYIYLDHAATTPALPALPEVMLPYFTTKFGNPSSVHHYGREARKLIDESRFAAAKSIGALENEIVFTSGGTEADNYAIIGAALANQGQGKHIITTQIEHHAVLHACHYLEGQGFDITYLPVDKQGLISINQLKKSLKEDTILVSIMFGNNEVGTIQSIGEIGEYVRGLGVLFHTDAVQAYGIVPINVKELNIDLLSTSSHKINGPKGAGFLFVREGVNLAPLFHGGEQERKRRAGTENVPAIAGFHEAILNSSILMVEKQKQYNQFKDKMISIFKEAGIAFLINGKGAPMLPHILNVSFPGTNVESMLVNLDLVGISVSSGSACTAGSVEPSHVLVAMHGKAAPEVLSSIRYSFGLGNTVEEITRAANETVKIVNRLVK